MKKKIVWFYQFISNMLTEKDYCDYDTCAALSKLGCPMAKEGYLGLSLYSAQKWLREEKHLHIEVRWYSNLWYEYRVKEAEGKILAEVTSFKTYEDALSEGIKEAVKILKEEEK